MPLRRVTGGGLAVLVAALVLAASVPPAAAQGGDGEGNPAWAEDLFVEMEGMAETYNGNVDGARENMSMATRQVYNRLTGKRVNAYIHGTDVVFSFRMTSDGRIVDLRPRPNDDARLAMYMTRDTAESLAAAEKPVGAFVSAVQRGRFVGSGDSRTVRGVVIRGEQGRPVEQATWTIINTAKGLFF